jgi:hypothetical protein
VGNGEEIQERKYKMAAVDKKIKEYEAAYEAA